MTAPLVPGGSQSLCRDCDHLQVVTSAKGSVFWRCKLPGSPVKYPQQPVVRCAGYRAGDKE